MLTGFVFRESSRFRKKIGRRSFAIQAAGISKPLKMKVGLSIEEDLRYIKAIREAIGPEMRLMIRREPCIFIPSRHSKLSLAAEQYAHQLVRRASVS
ncbi:hypothetical protein [Reichenbachiella ulvae]|uniref:Uncharacterized protein n=1 Tax=Reichenbachiella ulvae TaxID=2980104 RepID=A0ABT3D163_9BACT|nr:hypothetical protein [Reichenbachiella ulvae]MCV9389490.1 hypothetical protein [Reichenbachiella ulvae]